MKKFLSVLFVFLILLASLTSCGGVKGTYTFVFFGSDNQGRVYAEFDGGELTIGVDESGLNSNAIDNLAVALTMYGMTPGTYEYSEEDGIITTTSSLSPLSSEKTVFKFYFDGKYIVASTFNSMEITTDATGGLSNFSINSDYGILIFNENGNVANEEGETVGTYTFEEGLIEITSDGEVIARYFAPGDKTCYTEFLVKE